MQVLLKNCGFIITQNRDRAILRNFDILIEEGRIKEIKKEISVSTKDCEILDCRNKIVLPAFLNLHTHSPMTLLRGYKDDLELHPWLQEIWKVEAKLKDKHFYIGAKFACLEMIKSGISCFLDMYFGMGSIFRAVVEAGIRGFLGEALMDFKEEGRTEEEIKKAEKFADFCIKAGNPLIKPVIAPHSIYTCSPSLLLRAKEIAREKGLLFTIHLSETRKEVFDCYKEHKKKPVNYLKDLNLLDEKFIAFHCVWLTREEISILAKSNAKAVHCPISNMKLATGGVFPFREMKESNILIGLGTDGACSNNSLNILEEMKVACLLQKWFRWNASEISSQEALDLVTINGAKILGINSGSIEEGKDADLVFLNKEHLSLLPSQNLISNLVFSCSREAISDLMVRGRFVMRDRKVLSMDEEKTKEEFKKALEELIA